MVVLQACAWAYEATALSPARSATNQRRPQKQSRILPWQVLQQAGRIDILVNNAGLGGRGPVCEYDLGAARRVFEVNVFGTLAMTQVRGLGAGSYVSGLAGLQAARAPCMYVVHRRATEVLWISPHNCAQWPCTRSLQAVVPHMLQRRSGTVINIGSALGLLTLPFTGAWGSTAPLLVLVAHSLVG